MIQGYPIPPVYLIEREKNTFIVVDGKQRLTTIINHFKEDSKKRIISDIDLPAFKPLESLYFSDDYSSFLYQGKFFVINKSDNSVCQSTEVTCCSNRPNIHQLSSFYTTIKKHSENHDDTDIIYLTGRLQLILKNIDDFRIHTYIGGSYCSEDDELVVFRYLNAGSALTIFEKYNSLYSDYIPGQPPPTLFEYLPKDAVLFIDESHVTVPQIGAMSRGDRARKETLSQYGFRLPSCVDNRPLTFDEWDNLRPQTIFVSATPATWELEQSGGIVSEQVIRPTGLLDPICEVRPTTHQVDDLLNQVKKISGRVLVTTLTKKMAEQLTDYLNENGVRAKYLHSDIETLERIELLRELRMGKFDVLVGINLLREGLDVPECELVAIMDADKEGFLRSTRSLIQTIGRAARNANGRVILYADKITDSMRDALDETARRRAKQMAYNMEHGIVPKTVSKAIFAEVGEKQEKTDKARRFVYDKSGGVMDSESIRREIKKLTQQMHSAAEDLEFERAAEIRDIIRKLEDDLLLVE